MFDNLLYSGLLISARKRIIVLMAPLLLLACRVYGEPQHNPNFYALSNASDSLQHHARIEQIIQQISASEIEKNLKTLVEFGTRHSLSDTAIEVRGIGAARRWIFKTFQEYSAMSGGRLKVEMDRFTAEGRRLPGPTKMVNIVATLPGRHPSAKDRIYVVSGHYDSRNSDPMDGEGDAPGANDDGSGTVVVMELARVMSQYEFDATLVFMNVAGEEQGLYGSKHWAEEAQHQGLNIGGMITNDVVGGGRGGNGVLDLQTLRCFSAEPLDSPQRQLARFAENQVRTYLSNFSLRLIFRQDRYGRGGDHMSFMRAGYPAVRFTEANENYDHQHQDVRQEDGKIYGDLIEFVDFNYIANVTRANAAILSALAMSPPLPKNVTVEGAIRHDTQVSWAGAQDGVSYEVVLRETTAPQWQKKVDVKSGTEVVLKGIAIDNYFFGVRAVSKDGYLSIVAVPVEK